MDKKKENETITKIETQIIEKPSFEIINTENQDDNKDDKINIYGSIISFNNNEIINNNSFLDQSSELMLNKIKSFPSHQSIPSFHSFSSKKKNELISSVDFEVKRTKTIEFDIFPFEEVEENEKEEESKDNIGNNFTNIKYVIKNIPVLKENEFKNLEIEVKPFLDKYKKSTSVNESQNSKEEITTIKKEIVTTTRTENKIINLSGKKINDTNEENNNNIINNRTSSTNKNNKISKYGLENKDLKKKLSFEEEYENLNDIEHIKKKWKYFVQRLIMQYNNKIYKENITIILKYIKHYFSIKYKNNNSQDNKEIIKEENYND